MGYDWGLRMIRDSASSKIQLDVQICALVGIPLAGLGEFGIRVGSEPNDHCG
jgi:hypothetical protein